MFLSVGRCAYMFFLAWVSISIFCLPLFLPASLRVPACLPAYLPAYPRVGVHCWHSFIIWPFDEVANWLVGFVSVWKSTYSLLFRGRSACLRIACRPVFSPADCFGGSFPDLTACMFLFIFMCACPPVHPPIGLSVRSEHLSVCSFIFAVFQMKEATVAKTDILINFVFDCWLCNKNK